MQTFFTAHSILLPTCRKGPVAADAAAAAMAAAVATGLPELPVTASWPLFVSPVWGETKVG